MALPDREETWAARKESTYNADPIAGSPTGTDFLKMEEGVIDMPIAGIIDAGAVGPFEPGFATLPGARSYMFSGRMELPGLTVSGSGSTIRGWQALEAAGFKDTYEAGPPKTQTITYDPAENSSLTVYHYQRHRPKTGSPSHQLDIIKGARTKVDLLHRDGRWWLQIEGKGASGSQSEGVTFPTAAPYVDGNGAYAMGLTWAKTSIVTFQDSAGENVLTTGIEDLTTALGGGLEEIRAAGYSGDPSEIVRTQGRRTGTLRLVDPGRGTWNPRSIQAGPLNLTLVSDLVALESANNKATLYLALTIDSVRQRAERGVKFWDVNFGLIYPTDGTAQGRTPASTFKVVYSTSS